MRGELREERNYTRYLDEYNYNIIMFLWRKKKFVKRLSMLANIIKYVILLYQ